MNDQPPRKALEFISKLRATTKPESVKNEFKAAYNDTKVPGLSKVAQGSRNVRANKLADEYRKEHK